MPTASSVLLRSLLVSLLALASLPAQIVVPAHPSQPPPAPPAADADRAAEGDASAAADQPVAKEPRRGIPVDDTLVHTHCARCHALDDRRCMTRISYVRKAPEGWSETIKRMVRLHGVALTPDLAKQLVRTLSNSHGLARSEAERGLYESERRVHWSEEQHDEDFRRACAQCHTLGRVLLQQRDAEEWQLLRATHVAMFPLSRGDLGGGPPEEEPRRRPGQGGAGATAGRGRTGGGNNAAAAETGPREGGNRRGSVGDRVLQKLTEDQPLFTDAWDKWQKNRREVPLAGTWTAVGHETGRGALFGTVELQRTDVDEYDVVWRLAFADGAQVERSGKGVLYAGYSWRGRGQDADGAAWREVLLLDDAWQSLRGRLFTGDYDEIGVDVVLHRSGQRPRVLALAPAAIEVPSTGQRIEAFGEALPDNLGPADWFVGAGLTVTAVERHSDRRATLVVDAAAGAELGARTVALGADPGVAQLQLYDAVDYVRIRPLQGLARIGGSVHTSTERPRPRQIERFEAFAVHRGADGKPFTDDDVDLFQVRPRWSLEEFRVRDDDDDVGFVGSIDATTGVFTPALDGPNEARRWQANNTGDVFVCAMVELDTAVRPEPPKPGAAPTPAPTAPPPLPSRERRTFRARSHLIVTVPLYTRWQALDWEAR